MSNGRRDSYVTHRAYCVALAEETARLNAASSTIANNSMAATADSNNNINYHFLKPTNNNIISHQYFPSNFFKPDHDHQTAQIFLNNNNNSLTPFLIPQLAAPSSQQINNLQDNIIINSNFHHHPLLSVPSLYSHEEQQQAHQALASSAASANMSATVLLQKAAQIGVTSSTTTDPSSSSSPLMMGSFGLKLTDGKALFSGLYGSIMNYSNSLPSCSSLENGGEDSAASNLVQMYPAAKRIRHTVSEESVTGGEGETRDFLGVGMHTICHPSAVNGWI